MFLWLVVLVLLVLLVRAWSRLGAVERKLDELRSQMDALTRRPGQPAGRPEVVAPPARAAEPTRAPATAAAVAAPPTQRPAVPAAPRVSPAPPMPPPAAEPIPPTVPSVARPVAPVPSLGGPVAPATPPEPRAPFDWEGLIGVKLFSRVAAVALLLAAFFFLKYSYSQQWIQPPLVVAILTLLGVGLIVACELRAARAYEVTANALDAVGIGILFGTFWAAHGYWHLINALVTFGLLVVVAAVAVLLSIRRASMFIALLGLLGGFGTPVILASGQDNPIGLFSYLLVLNAGLAWVAYREGWPVLTALSVAFTTLYQWGWVSRFLTTGKLPLAIGIFVVFPIVSFIALAVGQRRSDEAQSQRFGNIARVSAVLPLLFSFYIAAVPAYGARYPLLFGFLFLLDAGLFAIAVAQGPRQLHALGALSVLLVFVVWLDGSYTHGAWPGILGYLALFVLFHLAAPWSLTLPWVRKRLGEVELASGMLGVFAAPLLLFAFPVLLAIEPRAASPLLPFGVLLVLAAACAGFAIARQVGAVHYIAAFLSLVAEAVWSARYLTPDRLLPALGVYCVFALLHVGVPVLARSRGHALRPRGAGGAVALGGLALLFFLCFGAVASMSLWGIALLLAILNVGLRVEGAAERLPLLSAAGVVISWLVLSAWWLLTGAPALVVPGLLVIVGFVMLTLAGTVWARRRAEGDTAQIESTALLALVGHAFVAFVAMQPTLATPPWPIFGALLVLDLAAAVAALALRSGSLQMGATVASAFVLMLFEATVTRAPWPAVSITAAAVLIGLAALWAVLARRMSIAALAFDRAGAVTALLAMAVAALAGIQEGEPAFGILLGAQLAFIAALFAFVALDVPRLGWLAVAALLPAAAAGFIWQSMHPDASAWGWQLLFTAAIYLAYSALPFLMGRREGNAITPYVAAVLASALFFVQARSSVYLGGYGFMIGALPVAEAALLALVLRHLVLRERARAVPRTREELTRLALVGGAVLAFVTVAIPLQLEKNWITIGWALEGAALAWLYRRVPHRGVLAAAAILLAVVFVRLALNPSVLTYEPRGALRIWNWYLYTYLLCAAALLAAGRFMATTDDRLRSDLPRLSLLLSAGGTILLFLLLNIEIADYYATGPTLTFDFSGTLAQDLTYTLGWALFALALLAAGIATQKRGTRFAALGLLIVATVKAFAHDFYRLGGLYRVGSLVGVAVCLFLVGFALQRFVRPASSGTVSRAG